MCPPPNEQHSEHMPERETRGPAEPMNEDAGLGGFSMGSAREGILIITLKRPI